ncbi:MAG: DUF2789 domain-containing protein [Psychrosphaera sp.]|nr:DUF2789 domain-containing protein [Psychrosphaera sp.]
MDTTPHNFSTLFAQLGLENDKENIERFIASHKLDNNLAIKNAPFWNPSQKMFIQESLHEDGDWSEMIDQLDNLLRN